MMGFAIVRFPDHKKRTGAAGALPPGPRLLSLTEPEFYSQRFHHFGIERECPIEIRDTDEDVRKHIALLKSQSASSIYMRFSYAPTTGRADQVGTGHDVAGNQRARVWRRTVPSQGAESRSGGGG